MLCKTTTSIVIHILVSVADAAKATETSPLQRERFGLTKSSFAVYDAEVRRQRRQLSSVKGLASHVTSFLWNTS